jgi:AcrR family transcriptional regulator
MVETTAPAKEQHDSRSLILTVALELFTRQGYDGTSIDDVRQAAGFKSKASLYTHFKSKEELATALLQRWGGEEEKVIMAAYEASPAEPLARFVQMGRAFIEWGLTHPREHAFRYMRVQQEKLIRGQYDYLSGERPTQSYPIMLGLVEEMRGHYPVRAIDSRALLSMMSGIISKAVIDQGSFGTLSLGEKVNQILQMCLGILFSTSVELP